MTIHRWPDIMVVKKKETNALLINVGSPGDVKVEKKKEEKVMNYQYLAYKEEIVALVEIFFTQCFQVTLAVLDAGNNPLFIIEAQ